MQVAAESFSVRQQVGMELAEAIARRGMSQAHVAKLAGVSAKHLNQVINGHAFASSTTLDRLASVLDARWDIVLRL